MPRMPSLLTFMQITSLMCRQLANVCSDGARLEIVCGLIPHLGFKSLTLRQYTPCPSGVLYLTGILLPSGFILVLNWYLVKGCVNFFPRVLIVLHRPCTSGA